MVQAITVNGQGKRRHHSRPCFGFMAYINQWDECYRNRQGEVVSEDDDEFDWDDVDHEYCSDPEFASDNLHQLIWLPHPRFNSPEVGVMLQEDFMTIVESFPQFYSEVKIRNMDKLASSSNNWRVAEVEVEFPLVGRNMQVTIIGAMMLRNILEYTCANRTYEILRNKGYSPKMAFVYSLMFNGNENWNNETVFWYQCNEDSSMFQDDTQIHDILMLLDGRLGHIWQDVWGSTECGYGRDGNMSGDENSDSEDAPIFARLGSESVLKDILMDVKGAEADSPDATTIESIVRNNTDSYHGISEEEMVKCVAIIDELIKGN